MEKVKATSEYTILKKRSGRFGIKDKSGSWINGEKKAQILSTEGLIKLTAPTAKAEESAIEESAE